MAENGERSPVIAVQYDAQADILTFAFTESPQLFWSGKEIAEKSNRIGQGELPDLGLQRTVGQPLLDPRAMGVARNEKNERVSLIAVS